MLRTLYRTAMRPARIISCTAVALAALLSPAGKALAQQPATTVAGTVTELRSNRPLANVAVQVNGTRLGGVTGDDGRYRIAGVPAGSQVLSFRRLGYASATRPATVAASGVTTVNAELTVQAQSLDELVVTGTAGGEIRRSIGNAVTTISAPEATQKAAAQNLSSLIGARAPGVIIAPGTGRIGSGPTIQIRGRSSIGLDNSPLLYIDGVRVNNSTAAGPVAPTGRLGGQGSNVAGRLNDINPEDIESIEIIKGPAAATIYGTEAANGVIQIITKKGALSGQPIVRLQVQDGIVWFRDAAGRVPTNYSRSCATCEIVAWNAVEAEEARGTPIFNTGQTRQYSGSVSGGRDVVRYYVSSAYQNDLGIEPNNSLRQFTFHANTNIVPNEKIDFGSSVNYVNTSSHLGADFGASALLGAVAGHPLVFTVGRGHYPNIPPEVPQTLYDNAQGVNRFTGSATFNHRPTTWFSQRLVAGMDLTSDDSRAIERFATPDLAIYIPGSASGSIGQTIRRNTIASVDYSGTAKVQLTDAFSSSSSIGGQFFRTELNSSFLGGIGFPGPSVETVSAVATPSQSTQTQIINTTIGAFGQQQFGWRDRLFVTAALRVDNNSAFGSDFKWVTYPKLSAAWVVNEESFWPANSYVNSLKLRGAYGESGRQPNAFSALRTFSPAQGPGGTSAVTPNTIGNADLKPERGRETELGFDAEMFGRLGLDFTWYSKKTQDVIISQPIAPSSGFSGSQFANLGRVDNSGFELLATLQAITRDNFSWEIVGNLARNADVIKDLGGIGGTVLSAGQLTNVVGYPIGAIFTRRIISADRDPVTGAATNILCEGAGGAGVACATAPFQYIGTPTPRTTGSVSNTVWLGKNLRLYGLVDFKRGHRQYNTNDALRCSGAVGAQLCRSTYYPLEFDPLYLAARNNTSFQIGASDQYYESADFAKLRELSATITVPQRYIRGFSAASVTIAGRELHTWTDFTGIDPEGSVANPATSPTTGNQGLIPPLSRLIATVNLSF